MGNGASSKDSVDSKSIAVDFLAKFALVLSKTKDALITDLKERLSNDISDDFNLANIQTLVDNLFNLLGYDVRDIIPKQISDATQEVFDVSEDLAKIITGISKIVDDSSDFLDIFEDEASGEELDNIFIGFELLIKDIVEMVRAFKKLGDTNLDAAAEQWSKFVEESNFEKDVPKRLFDHIISVFMRNASEVFSSDIKRLKETVEIAKESMPVDLQKPITDIITLLNDALADIDKGFDESLKTLSKKLREVISKITVVLENQLSENQKKSLTLLRSFIKVEEYFKRIYTVLDFMQVISQEKVQIFSLNDNAVSLSTEIYVIHWSRFEEMAKNPIEYFKVRYPVNSYADAQELISKLISVAQAFGLDIPDFDSLKSMLIDLLRRLEKSLEKLVNEEIKNKIKELKKLINTLLLALERIAMEAKNVIKTNLDLTLKEIAKELNLLYQSSVGALNNKKLIDAKAIKNDIERKLNSMPNLIKSISDISFQPLPGKDILQKSLEEIILPVILKKASEFKEFGAVTEADWQKLIVQIGTSFTSVYSEIKKQISDVSQTSTWTIKLEDLKNELERQTKDIPTSWAELQNTIFNNPNKLSPDKLFSQFDVYAYFTIVSDTIKEILSFLDPETYYTKFKKVAIESFVLLSNKTDATASHFKSIAEGNDSELVNIIFTSFINNVLIESWKELRKEILDVFLHPFLQSVEAVVKSKVSDILEEILKTVSSDIKELQKNVPHEYIDFVKEVFPVIYKTTQKGVDNWSDGITLALKLGKPLYKLIDGVIDSSNDNDKTKSQSDKDEITKAIGIPASPNVVLSGKHKDKVSYNLPSYSLDIDNKFLTVTLYDSRGKYIKKKNNYFSFSVSLFVGEKGDTEENSQAGIYIIPVMLGNYGEKFNIGKTHQFSLALNAALNSSEAETKDRIKDFQKGAIGIFFSKSNFELLKDTGSISASTDLSFFRKEEAGSINIIESKYLDFSIGNYPQTLSLGYKEKAFFAKYKGELQKGEFVLKIREINDFFAELLKDDIKAKFDIALIYDTVEGFSFDGSASLKVDFNLNKKIADVFTLNKLGVEVGPSNSQDSVIRTMVNTSFTIDTKSVVFYVKDLGIGVNINYLKKNGSLGDFDLSPIFTFPSGLGVSIDATAVKGTGVISYDDDKKEFLGVLELVVLEKIEVKALALLTMKMPDGSKGFSFVGLISVFFIPGIPLGMGFSLTGLGGAVGLNRSIDKNKMQTGVRAGEIAAVFFVENIEDNLDTLLTQIGSYFPIKRNQFFFGILARISYTEILHVDFGLLIQAPKPSQIIIVGALFVALPTKEAALVKINVYFAGGIDFDEGMWFDASIVDSEIVKIQIYGDMAFRLYWGKNKGFLFSAGGFHPAYRPDAAFDIGIMKRLGMKLDYKVLKLTLESYFAITSNSVQLGAQVDLRIGWKSVGIFGYFGFDCLFQFKPFRFLFDVRMGVEARWGRWTLFSISLEFALAGPAKWNAKGCARFKILFFTIKVKFNLSWGKDNRDSEISYTATYDLISQEYYKIENWKVVSSNIQDQQVRLVEQNTNNNDINGSNVKELIMQPFSGIMFEQPLVPLEESMQRFGEGVRPQDYSSIKISKVEIGTQLFSQLSSTDYDFAPSLFFDLNDQEKLSVPSYQKMKNGVKVENGLRERAVSTLVNKKIEYVVEQDNISFSDSKSYTITDDNNVAKTLVVNQLPKTMRANVQETNISVLDAFVQISNRSDSGFKRHVNKVQHIQKENNNEKINKFFEEMETDFGMITEERDQNHTQGENVVPGKKYSNRIRRKSTLSISQPELDRRFIFVKKRRTKVF